MASLRRRGRRWHVIWWEAGRGSKRHILTCQNKSIAELTKARVESQLAAARPLRALAVLPWAEVVARFCRSRAHTTQIHRDQVTANLARAAAAHGWTTTGSIVPATCEGLPSLTARHLRAVLRYAIGIDQPVDQRVLLTVRPRPTKRRPQDLPTAKDVAEAIRQATAWSPGAGAIVHLIATYGHRAESLVRLERSALDLSSPTATLTLPVKSGDVHRHPLLPATRKLLKALKPGEGTHLFLDPDGQPWASATAFVYAWRHRIPLGILPLRRYAITRLVGLGLDAKTVASITGHRTPSLLLNVYARTTETRQVQALAALSQSIR